MAAEAQHATCSRERESIASRLRRFFAPIEPWYDWGKGATIWRIDSVERDFSDESYTENGRYVELQWLGFSLKVVAGRTPSKVSPTDVARNKARQAASEAAR